MTTSNLYNLLQECKVEKDVEEKYKRIISEHFPKGEISSPYYTDGVLKDDLTMLMEFKHNLDLTKRLQLVELLIQMLYYLKQFELHGEELPTIIFGGDVNECFCLHSNVLIDYLNEDIDWSIAPSAAASQNPNLAMKLSKDENVNPYIWHIDNDHFDFQFVVDYIKQLHEGTVQKIRITELNINRFFSYFRDRIIKQTKKYTPEELVSIFLNCLIDSNNNYPHPKKKTTLVTNVVGDVFINRSIYDSFFEHFESEYSVEEKKRLTAICDRLIADEARRFHGEFYTPTEWVLEAHKMIEETFGPNWKEEYVVWDPAWGTGNLTRDFKFKELYCSTLNYGDLQVGQYYNPEAVKFQYDFLNDDVAPKGVLHADKIKKLPDGLVSVLKSNRPIIILMNPPYATSSHSRTGGSKKGISETLIRNLMKTEKLGDSVKQLYGQFLYRIICFKRLHGLTNINIAFYSTPTFLSGDKFQKFRNIFLNEFNFKNGMLFNAGSFSGVNESWNISFSLFSCGPSTSKENFTFIYKYVDDEYKMQDLRNVNIYNLDTKKRLNKWGREDTYGIKAYDAPQLSAPTTLKQDGYGRLCKESLGYIWACKNTPEGNASEIALFTSTFSGSNSNGWSIFPYNIEKVISLFTARKTIVTDRTNKKDEYLAPNEQHPEYSQWNTDAIIYSLFNGSSNQSSLRQITYKDKLWDIKNEWFWMQNETMLQLANENGFDELYHDANGDHDRFVFTKIIESSFSPDAAAVYNKACQLVVKTFPYRQPLHEEHPEWHLHAWDAGWYQIKLILKKYFKDDLKEFNVLYKEFEDRMREGVYKFGFLK